MKSMLKRFLSGLLACLLLCGAAIAAELPGQTGVLTITFFDQNPYLSGGNSFRNWHGDSTFIQLPNGQNMLVDIGTTLGGKGIAEALQQSGVEKLDYLVVSHLHQDHTGGLKYLLKKLPVDELIFAGYGLDNRDVDTDGLPLLKAELRKGNIKQTTVRQGDSLTLGDVTLDILWPAADAPEVTGRNIDLDVGAQGTYLNMYSLVFRLHYGDFSILFTGDIYTEAEAALVSAYGDQLRSTVLKLPHHGHDTSSSDALIKAVSPAFAVAMSTRVQSQEVADRLAMLHVPEYGSWQNGSIVIQTDGHTVTVANDAFQQTFELR